MIVQFKASVAQLSPLQLQSLDVRRIHVVGQLLGDAIAAKRQMNCVELFVESVGQNAKNGDVGSESTDTIDKDVGIGGSGGRSVVGGGKTNFVGEQSSRWFADHLEDVETSLGGCSDDGATTGRIKVDWHG